MASPIRSKFSWPKYPESDSEFEELMMAIDKRLSDDDLKPSQRPMHAGLFFSDAFNWEGNAIPPKELADKPGFSGDMLMAKAYKWYDLQYGEQLKSDWALGYFAIKISNAIWKVRVPVFFGTCNFFVDKNLSNKGESGFGPSGESSANILLLIEKLPQGLADKLSIDEIERIVEEFTVAVNVFTWRERLVGHDYFREAYRDYSVSTDEVLKSNYGQSRWASAQSVEKTLKGLLAIRNLPVPKGKDGHNLVKLGQTLKKQLNIELSPVKLAEVNCSPDVRYGEEPSTQNDALVANNAVVEVLWQLSECSKVNAVLAEWHVLNLPGKLK